MPVLGRKQTQANDLRERTHSGRNGRAAGVYMRLPKEAYLKLKGYGDWRRQRIGPLPADQQVEPGAMLMFGTPF